MNNPLVSIVIPLYNSESRIGDCLRSIFLQTYKNFEVILIDDGSTDGTGEICRKVQKENKNVTYFYQENRGPSSARNVGLEKATGEYLLFVDSDDRLIDSAVQELVHLALISYSDLISFDFSVVNEYGNSVCKETVVSGQYPSNEVSNGRRCLEYIYNEQGVANFSWAFFYTMSFLRKSEVTFPEDVRLLEDALFLNRLLRKASVVRYCNHPLYLYSIGWENSLTRVTNDRNADSGLRAVEEIGNLADSDGLLPTFIPQGVNLLLFIESLSDTHSPTAYNRHRYIRLLVSSWAGKVELMNMPIRTQIKIFLIRLNILRHILSAINRIRSYAVKK